MAQEGRIYRKSKGGTLGLHPQPRPLPLLVAATDKSGFNTIRDGIVVYACWRIEDLRFEFDSSFVKPEIAEELQALAMLIEEHTKDGRRPPASVFGHADPIGRDDYNKVLGGRRAIAIYGLLTRRVELWEELYSQPFGGDSWRQQQVTSVMLATLGYGDTKEEVRRFQQDHDLDDDGVIGVKTRRDLFRAYMDALCPIVMDPGQDFLARGEDTGGKADYQGCGEFNPVLLFAQEEEKEFSKPQNKRQRDEENAPNRRVLVFLFRPGVKVTPARWPCPRAREGMAGCRQRFWSDGERRRGERLPGKRRDFQETKDTFACRFYHRLASNSPCEQRGPQVPSVYDESIELSKVEVPSVYDESIVFSKLEGPSVYDESIVFSKLEGPSVYGESVDLART